MKISYETAVKLKEAGFPQKLSIKSLKILDLEHVYKPNLSELIEACGDKFKSLERLQHPEEEGSFWAQSVLVFGCCALTKEEAVANLYLLLKKNGKI